MNANRYAITGSAIRVRNLLLKIQGKYRSNSLIMERPKRAAQAVYIYHVLKRANARMTIF